MTFFRLATMSPLIFWLTAFLLAIPAGFAVGGLVGGSSFAAGVAGALIALYGWVWLRWRPRGFEVGAGRLDIVFPARRKRIPLADVAGCREITAGGFRREFGFAVRVGVGGLWGGFGWLWTRRRGWVEFYVSRTDGLLLVERRSGKTLLLTPDDPPAMVAEVERFSGLAGGR